MTIEAPTGPARPARSNRPFWIAIGVLALLWIATYAWKVASVNRVEDRLAEREAMARNYGLMQERFERLLREPGVERVLYATAGDSIAVATHRSLIGKPLSSAVPDRYARPVGTHVVFEDGAYQAIVPITGLNERLGVVVLTYRQPRMDAD